MKKLNELSRRDLERLSAYLDGELSEKDRAHLEARLQNEPHLGEALQELQLTSKLVSSLPQVRVPRNFMLTPDMVGIREKRSMYPVFRFATVVAAVAFAVLIGADTFFLHGAGLVGDATLSMAPEMMLDQAPVREFEVAEEAAEAPVEKPVMIEAVITPTEEAMGEIIVEGEADRGEPEAPSASGVDETQEFALEKTDDLPLDQQSNELTLTPEGTFVATEVSEDSDAANTADGFLLTMTPVPLPSPSATEIPMVDFGNDPSGRSIEPIHAAEIGLGIAALLLAGITIYLRKRL